MTVEAIITALVGALSGGVGMRLWATRKERGDDYERLIKLYREEVERCTKQCGELQQKLLIFMQENAELRQSVDTQRIQIEQMEELLAQKLKS